MKKLGVNVDHVATLRNAREGVHPNPLEIARLCVHGGADNITFHLREDRRHIKDQDVLLFANELDIPLNFEMACTSEMVQIAKDIKPQVVTFVPEKREELTTEGGLDVTFQTQELTQATKLLQDVGVEVSFFIEPDQDTIDQAKEMGANGIEIHTGAYAHAFEENDHDPLLKTIEYACEYAFSLGLDVHVGHGLNQRNLPPLTSIDAIHSFQIGHALIADALVHGIESTVIAYKRIINP